MVQHVFDCNKSIYESLLILPVHVNTHRFVCASAAFGCFHDFSLPRSNAYCATIQSGGFVCPHTSTTSARTCDPTVI
jgi:hypothetical protein